MDKSCPPASTCNPAADSLGIVVLGIGNLLWADEGFGVRCVEALQAGWDLGADGNRFDLAEK